MKLETIQKLCCPFDKAELDLQIITRDTSNNIMEGVLTCTQCQRYYPIICGIPIMSPDEYREKQLEAPLVEKWNPELLYQNSHDFKLLESSKE
ncbi:Trm112 family protein [Adhaeribacter radiodurans]|uniref:Trm112 family protein n=1 Tax=Adhaeribacter radiodurans TaxID=2745197 RepID=A0A7L7LEW6_9BACT|nr:Trm112 family protein [Adhaeribacter radiodurans]QMU31224.1 hypothetical protein HUW48_25760 [Adhaeribacter radiodurans]